MKNLQFDLNSSNTQLEIVTVERDDFQKQANKAHDETRVIRDQANKDFEAKNEELEDVKRKLNAKYLLAQEQLGETVAKLSNSDKIKSKLQVEVENLSSDLDRVRIKFLF
jgi:hypothetical protein